MLNFTAKFEKEDRERGHRIRQGYEKNRPLYRGEYCIISGVPRRGDMGECPPRHGLKKIFSPWITDRWLLCNWCHTTDVAKTKGKCAISTLIFRKFSGGYAPDPHTGEGLRRPSPHSSALRASAPRSGPLVPRAIVVSPLTKILATRLYSTDKQDGFSWV